jgi:DNA repair protein RadD
MLTSGSKHGHFFKEIIHVTQIQELVSRGYWSKLVYDIHEFDRSLLEYNGTKADFTEQSLHWSFERASIRTKILEHASANHRKSTLIFVPSIEEAIKIERQLDSCKAVHSKLKPAERDRIIEDFKSGRLRHVVNVNVLSVGFDHPELDHIISGRPTASLAWFYQALGRGTRIAKGKSDCLITDFVGNVERFGKIEELVYKKKKAWQLYGEGGKLLTGIGLHNIGTVTDEPDANVVFPFGKHKDKTVGHVLQHDPGYIKWLMSGKDFQFTKYSMHIKEAIDRLSKKEQVTH